MEDLVLPPYGQPLDGKSNALGGDLVVGVGVPDGVSLFLEEPLTHVLMVSWFGPGVVIDIEGFFLSLSILLRRWRLSLLSLRSFWLLHLLRLLQMQDLVMVFHLLARPDTEVPDDADVLLQPVEVLGNKILVDLTIVAEYHIAVMPGSDHVANLSEGVFVEVKETEVVADGQVLIEEGVVLLDEVDAGLEQILEQLLSDQDLLVEVDLVEAGERTLACKLLSPVDVLGDDLLDLRSLFLTHFRIHIGLVLSPGPAGQLLLLHLEVEHGGWSDHLYPILDLLGVEVDPIDDQWGVAAFSNESIEMRNHLAEGQFLSVLGSDQLLLDGCNIGLVLNVLVPELAGDVLRGSGLPRTGSARNKQVLLVGLELRLEGNVWLYLSAFHELKEVYGAVDAFAELVVVRFGEISEELEVAGVIFEFVELLWLPREICEDDLLAIQVLEYHITKDFHFIWLALSLGYLPSQDRLDVEDVQQQTVCLVHVLPHDLPLVGLVHVRIDKFGQQSLPNFIDDGLDVLLAGDGVEAGLLLQGGDDGGFAVEEGLAACEFCALVFEVDDLEVEVGLKDGDFCRIRSELHDDVVLCLGVFADEVVGSYRGVDELVSDVAEVVGVQRLQDYLAGSVEDDQLRVNFLPKGGIVEFSNELRPPNHLILPLDGLLLLRVLPLHKNNSNLRLPLLHRPQQLHPSFDHQSLLFMFVQGRLRGRHKMLQMVLQGVLRGQRGFLFGAEDEVPDRLVSKLHFYDIIPLEIMATYHQKRGGS